MHAFPDRPISMMRDCGNSDRNLTDDVRITSAFPGDLPQSEGSHESQNPQNAATPEMEGNREDL